jgi:PAS domain S-box-containing protein
MKKNPIPQAGAAELRRQAEERLEKNQRGKVKKGEAPCFQEETQRLVQELQVHQIELEMQNEELKTSRAQVEAGLMLYTELYDFAPVGYFTMDRDGVIRRANLTSARLLGMERGQLAGRRLAHFVSAADRHAFNTFLQKVFASREKETCEAALSKQEKDLPSSERSGNRRLGEMGQIIVQIEAIASENVQECRAVMTDITSRKLAEEKIKTSLHEKEILLKEIHHRVKNNLQVISSLLNLQSSYLEDEKAREMLRNSMDRVKTMANIHTMLYQSEDMTRVDFGSFIRDLAARLQQSCGIPASPVEVHTDIADVSLTIETSVPCGLILNELVSNALKHAFPEGRGGEVTIGMAAEEDRFILTVSDNGIGFPETVDFRNTKSLGLELVNILVGQLNGAITLAVEGGTRFTITFPAAVKGG